MCKASPRCKIAKLPSNTATPPQENADLEQVVVGLVVQNACKMCLIEAKKNPGRPPSDLEQVVVGLVRKLNVAGAQCCDAGAEVALPR